jgi:hypothetical protein
MARILQNIFHKACYLTGLPFSSAIHNKYFHIFLAKKHIAAIIANDAAHPKR